MFICQPRHFEKKKCSMPAPPEGILKTCTFSQNIKKMYILAFHKREILKVSLLFFYLFKPNLKWFKLGCGPLFTDQSQIKKETNNIIIIINKNHHVVKNLILILFESCIKLIWKGKNPQRGTKNCGKKLTTIICELL